MADRRAFWAHGPNVESSDSDGDSESGEDSGRAEGGRNPSGVYGTQVGWEVDAMTEPERVARI